MIQHILKAAKHPGIQKYFFNTSWLFITHGVRLIVALFVGLLLARYLGPEQFGLYNYVIIILSVIASFARMGTEDQVTKNLILEQTETRYQLNDAFYLRFFLGLLSILGCYIVYASNATEAKYQFLLICSFGVILQSIEVIDLFYRATVQIKVSSLFRISQVIFSSILKLYLIYQKADLIYFFYIFVLDCLSYSIPLYLIYVRKEQDFVFIKPDIKKIIHLAKTCFPLMISTTAAILLSKIDQIAVADLLGKEEAGYYAASSKIIEIASIAPTLIITSLFTAIVNAKKMDRSIYVDRFKKISCLFLWFSILSSIGIYLLSSYIITILYSSKYTPSIEILKSLSFLLIPMTLMITNIKWFVAEGKNNIVMLKTIGAMIVNWILCLYLIPQYGYNGAITSTFFAHLFTFFIADVFFKNTREAFFINSSLFYFKRSTK